MLYYGIQFVHECASFQTNRILDLVRIIPINNYFSKKMFITHIIGSKMLDVKSLTFWAPKEIPKKMSISHTSYVL